MGDLFVIRHAQASFGGENYDRLSDLGRRQAGILGDYLSRFGPFHSVHSGTLERQTATAESIISRLSPRGQSPRLHAADPLNEYDSTAIITSQLPRLTREDPSLSGLLEHIRTDRRSLQRILERAMLSWISGRYPAPGVETWQAFNRRVRDGVAEIIRDAGRKKRVLVCTSGGPISVLMQMALGLSDEETIQLGWQIRNASVSTFKYNDTRLTLTSFNTVGHLEFQNEPNLITYR